jgi:hypothetical protein
LEASLSVLKPFSEIPEKRLDKFLDICNFNDQPHGLFLRAGRIPGYPEGPQGGVELGVLNLFLVLELNLQLFETAKPIIDDGPSLAARGEMRRNKEGGIP